MAFLPMSSAAADREHEQARRHPERETLQLAAAGAARGPSRWFGGCMTALRKKTLPRGGAGLEVVVLIGVRVRCARIRLQRK